MKRHTGVLAICLVATASAIAGDRRYPFEQIRLDNGLTVISLEDHSCPVVLKEKELFDRLLTSTCLGM